jgi:hypothetical protein
MTSSRRRSRPLIHYVDGVPSDDVVKCTASSGLCSAALGMEDISVARFQRRTLHLQSDCRLPTGKPPERNHLQRKGGLHCLDKVLADDIVEPLLHYVDGRKVLCTAWTSASPLRGYPQRRRHLRPST